MGEAPRAWADALLEPGRRLLLPDRRHARASRARGDSRPGLGAGADAGRASHARSSDGSADFLDVRGWPLAHPLLPGLSLMRMNAAPSRLPRAAAIGLLLLLLGAASASACPSCMDARNGRMRWFAYT